MFFHKYICMNCERQYYEDVENKNERKFCELNCITSWHIENCTDITIMLQEIENLKNLKNRI